MRFFSGVGRQSIAKVAQLALNGPAAPFVATISKTVPSVPLRTSPVSRYVAPPAFMGLVAKVPLGRFAGGVGHDIHAGPDMLNQATRGIVGKDASVTVKVLLAQDKMPILPAVVHDLYSEKLGIKVAQVNPAKVAEVRITQEQVAEAKGDPERLAAFWSQQIGPRKPTHPAQDLRA